MITNEGEKKLCNLLQPIAFLAPCSPPTAAGICGRFLWGISLHFYDRPQKLQLPPPADTHLPENPWHNNAGVLLPWRNPLCSTSGVSQCVTPNPCAEPGSFRGFPLLLR